MIVILAFYPGDSEQALRSLDWMRQLGGCQSHDCALVVDAGVEWGTALEAVAAANKAFRTATVITNDAPVTGWIQGSNSLFKTAAQYARKAGQPFLFLEPDAVPTQPDWLYRIKGEYVGMRDVVGTKFMGAVVFHQSPNLANPYLEGCAVYPAEAWSIMETQFNPAISWTLACAEAVLPYAANSNLFQHFWGPRRDFPPTFAGQRQWNSPENTLTLDDIRPGTALFHRCKDRTLIDLLKRKHFPSPTSTYAAPKESTATNP